MYCSGVCGADTSCTFGELPRDINVERISYVNKPRCAPVGTYRGGEILSEAARHSTLLVRASGDSSSTKHIFPLSTLPSSLPSFVRRSSRWHRSSSVHGAAHIVKRQSRLGKIQNTVYPAESGSLRFCLIPATLMFRLRVRLVPCRLLHLGPLERGQNMSCLLPGLLTWDSFSALFSCSAEAWTQAAATYNQPASTPFFLMYLFGLAAG